MAKQKKTQGRVYPPPKAVMKAHAIVDISYREDYIKCNCGWSGKTSEHDAHRKEAYSEVPV